jgi:hypothetical protein
MATLAESGVRDVRESTLAYWRRRKLLAPVTTEIDAYNGSATLHPPDTAARVVALRALQREKDDLDWIGAQLWWRFGFSVHEDLWRLALQKTADHLDPVLKKLARDVRREEEADSLGPTIANRVRPHFSGNIIASRMLKRVPIHRFGPVLKLVVDAAAGIEPEYEVPGFDDRQPEDQSRAIKAFDLTRADKDALAGQHFGFARALLPVLQDIARALNSHTLAEAATSDRSELEAARDEFRLVLELPVLVYQSTRWVYGEGAFGLRLADWVARKAPSAIVRPMFLIWLLMRRSGADLLKPGEVAELHELARQISAALLSLKWLSESDPQFAAVLNPKRVRAALSGKSPIAPWLLELEEAFRRSSGLPINWPD